MNSYKVCKNEFKNNELVLWPVMLIQFIYLAYAVSVPIGVAYLYISMAFFLAFIIVAFITAPQNLLNVMANKKYLCLLLFLIFYFVNGAIVNGVEQSAKLIGGVILCFSSMLIYDYFEKIALPQQLGINAIFGIGLLVYLSCSALMFYQTYKNAARAMGGDLSKFEGIALGGGYGLAYGLSIFTVCLCALILEDSTNKKYKPWLVGCTLLYAITVVQSAYTISILLGIIGIVIILAAKCSNGNTTYIALILITLLLTYSLLHESIGWLIIYNFSDQNDIVSRRIIEIGFYMLGQSGSSTDMVGRFDLYYKSAFAFSDNIFVGSGVNTGYLSDELKLCIGNHSEWFDALGLWGLFGGVPYLLSIYYGIKEKCTLATMIAPMIIFFLLGFVNPVRGIGIFYIVFYLIPTVANIVRKDAIVKCGTEK